MSFYPFGHMVLPHNYLAQFAPSLVQAQAAVAQQQQQQSPPSASQWSSTANYQSQKKHAEANTPSTNPMGVHQLRMAEMRRHERRVQVGAPTSARSIGSVLRDVPSSHPAGCECEDSHNCLDINACPCLAKGLYCGHACDCKNQPRYALERHEALVEQLKSMDAPETNKAIMPLVVHGHVVPGVMFGVSVPRPERPAKRQRTLLKMEVKRTAGETDLEYLRRVERQRLQSVMAQVGQRFQAKEDTDDAIGDVHYDILTHLHEMMAAAKDMELEVLTRWRTERKRHAERVMYEEKDVDPHLGCTERLPLPHDIDVNRQKELAIQAAQDTAIMQAVARFVRETARNVVRDTTVVAEIANEEDSN